MYTYVHSQHHQIGSAISALGTAFGDALDIGLCFVAFHLVLGLYLSYQPSWNIAAVVLLIIFEVCLPLICNASFENIMQPGTLREVQAPISNYNALMHEQAGWLHAVNPSACK